MFVTTKQGKKTDDDDKKTHRNTDSNINKKTITFMLPTG